PQGLRADRRSVKAGLTLPVAPHPALSPEGRGFRVSPAEEGVVFHISLSPWGEGRVRGRLPTVEDVGAEVFQPQRGVVGSALDALGEAGVHDFGYEHGVVATLDRVDEAALHEGRRVLQDRGAGAAPAKRLARDGVSVARGRLEKREGHALLALAEHVE